MSDREQDRQMVHTVFRVLGTRVQHQPKPQRKRRRKSKAQRAREYQERLHTTYLLINGMPHQRHADGTVTPI